MLFKVSVTAIEQPKHAPHLSLNIIDIIDIRLILSQLGFEFSIRLLYS